LRDNSIAGVRIFTNIKAYENVTHFGKNYFSKEIERVVARLIIAHWEVTPDSFCVCPGRTEILAIETADVADTINRLI
jgi:hypothetical protein